MLRKKGEFGLLFAFGAVLAVVAGSPAYAVPVDGQYIDDARCDPVANTHLSHELGDQTYGFPINEALLVTYSPTPLLVCAPDDGVANDWDVRITNLSSIAYRDLFFVADQGVTIGNADGLMFNGAAANDPPTDAFRIDGTVTITGGNDNLIIENLNANEIFEPGETWSFLVTNFGSSSPPVFGSIGLFGAGSAPDPGSNASILAIPVPEPITMTLVAPVALVALRRRRLGLRG